MNSLLREASYYSISSMIGRLFNVLLLPLYTAVMPPIDGEYGMMTSLYGWASVFTVVLSMGLETTFLRLANKQGQEGVNPAQVYSTGIVTVIVLTFVSGMLGMHFAPALADYLDYPGHVSEVRLMTGVVMGDVLLVLPFSYLRYRHKVARYAVCRALYAVVNAVLCFVVLYLCPRLQTRWPDGILWEFYLPHNSLNYVLGCNLTTCAILLYILIEEWKPFGHFQSSWGRSYDFSYCFSPRIFAQMMRYALPILGACLVDIGIQNLDRLLYPWLVPGQEGMRQLGIYGACFRIGMIMALATQVLRDISEPILFRLARAHRVVENTGALIIRYFIISSVVIFLLVEACMDPIQTYLLSDPAYWEGLGVVPILMCSEVLVGLQFCMSFWYKLTDRPVYGTLFAIATLIIIAAINVIFVPLYGYMACAWAIFAGCLVRLLLTFVVSRVQSHYRFHFSGQRYIYIGLGIYAVMRLIPDVGTPIRLCLKGLLLLLYVFICYRYEQPVLSQAIVRMRQRRLRLKGNAASPSIP